MINIIHKIIDTTNYSGCANEFEFAGHVKKEIERGGEKYKTLLYYPVVYIHAWHGDGCWNFYVGETNNAIRRTGEHSKKTEEWSAVWQNLWVGRDKAKSFYFGGDFMNKSMCLDLEYSLVEMLKQFSNCTTCHTKSVNKQYNYSNKHDCLNVLKSVWELFVEDADVKEALVGVKGSFNNSIDFNETIEKCDIIANPQDTYNCLSNDVVGYEENKQKNTDCLEKILNNYPLLNQRNVVYMHIWNENGKYRVYTGETDDIVNRTKQHLKAVFNQEQDANDDIQSIIKPQDENWHKSWGDAIKRGDAKMLVFGHKEFNKSLALDIENALIGYTIALELSANGRTNKQGQYNNKSVAGDVLKKILDKLNEFDSTIFKTIDEVRASSIFIASPFIELNQDQKDAMKIILESINIDSNDHKLIVVNGGAGTGKTVLASSLLFNLLESGYKTKFVVNNEELYNAYETQEKVWKINAFDDSEKVIYKAEEYNNTYAPLDKEGSVIVSNQNDVTIVDEGHLLTMQGKNGGIKTAQLFRIVLSSKVTVLMFDPNQFVFKGTDWAANWNEDKINNEDKIKINFEELLKGKINDKIAIEKIDLSEQMRMQCDEETRKWLESLKHENQTIYSFPKDCLKGKPLVKVTEPDSGESKEVLVGIYDKKKYAIAVYNDRDCFFDHIKNLHKSNKPSVVIATFDWPYDQRNEGWWHKTGANSTTENNVWTMAENPGVGSIHDIQGFDLNYAGVYLGPSITYEDNKIKFDQSKHEGGIKTIEHSVAAKLISNELGVLLSRGVKGIFLYAENENLRKALIDAVKNCN